MRLAVLLMPAVPDGDKRAVGAQSPGRPPAVPSPVAAGRGARAGAVRATRGKRKARRTRPVDDREKAAEDEKAKTSVARKGWRGMNHPESTRLTNHPESTRFHEFFFGPTREQRRLLREGVLHKSGGKFVPVVPETEGEASSPKGSLRGGASMAELGPALHGAAVEPGRGPRAGGAGVPTFAVPPWMSSSLAERAVRADEAGDPSPEADVALPSAISPRPSKDVGGSLTPGGSKGLAKSPRAKLRRKPPVPTTNNRAPVERAAQSGPASPANAALSDPPSDVIEKPLEVEALPARPLAPARKLASPRLGAERKVGSPRGTERARWTPKRGKTRNVGGPDRWGRRPSVRFGAEDCTLEVLNMDDDLIIPDEPRVVRRKFNIAQVQWEPPRRTEDLRLGIDDLEPPGPKR